MAIQTKKQLGLDRETADFLNNLALVYLWSGQLADAQMRFREAIALAEFSGNYFAKATMTANLAKTYRMVGETHTARRYYNEALALSDGKVKDRDMVNTHLALARIELMEEQFDHALEQLNQADELARSLRPEKLGLIYSLKAEAYAHQRNLPLAKEMSMMAEKSLEDILKASDRADAWVSIAKAQLKLAEFSLAQHSMAQASELISAEHPTQLKLRSLEYQMQLIVDKEDIATLNELFDRARQQVFQIESSLDFYQMGPNWLSHVRDLYDAHLTVLLNTPSADNAELALTLIDEYHSKAFLRKRLFYANQTDALPEQTDQIWQDKLETEIAVVNANSDEQKRKAIRKLDTLNEQWSITNGLGRDAETVQLIETVSVSDIQKSIEPKEAMLRYITLKDKCFVAAITKKANQIQTIQCPPELGEEQHFSGAQYANLYKQIHANRFVPDFVTRHDDIEKLIIIPDAKFHILPFSLLRIDHAQYRYLGTRYEIVRGLSVSTYLNERDSGLSKNSDMIAVFDSPMFQPPQTSIDHKPSKSWFNSLSDLDWALKEGDAIQEVFFDRDVDRKSREQAKNDVLLSSSFRRAKILHVATHGYFNPEQPEIVGLATSYRTTDKGFNVGFLSQSFLLSQPFDNQLVVLSGCETALGRYSDSEGYVSLSYGFISAGAGSAISTLWKVGDKPTAIFMRHFYSALRDTKSSSRALLMARRAMASESNYRYRSAQHWAGFALQLSKRDAEYFDF
jgi:CHAT domain-containing protein